MKYSRLFVLLSLLVVLAVSCKKGHYDLGNVHGVSAEGEALLPVASGSYSLKDLLERFQIDSLIECNAQGDLTYEYYYERFGIVKGADLLRFKDWNYQQHFVIGNLQGDVSQHVDTTIAISQMITFETDHVHVLSAKIKSGSFQMSLMSNISDFGEVIVTSPDIKDTDGHDMSFVYQPQMGMASFSFEGMEYQSVEANTLRLNYEFHLVASGLQVHTIEFDASMSMTDIAFNEMRGLVDPFAMRDRIDTVFSLFPNNMSGDIKVDDARITLCERNTFGLAARLVVDTALVWGERIPPYAIFAPMPVVIDLPYNPSLCEVYGQSVSGWIDTHLEHALASSLFAVNYNGMNDLVTINDTCNIDVRVDVSIPFSFNVREVSYMDTVNMKLDKLEMPDMIEELTLQITFNSTLPLDLHGKFMLYDTETGCVTDILLDDATLIAASYDGQASTSTAEFVITEDRVEKALRSDRIILCFDLDTDGHDVSLNANQGLDFYAKAKVKYNGTVEPDNL